MTRWNDISDEDKQAFTWVEVTTHKDEWPVYVKGAPRHEGRSARRWELSHLWKTSSSRCHLDFISACIIAGFCGEHGDDRGFV
jgi:hypothetical protein